VAFKSLILTSSAKGSSEQNPALWLATCAAKLKEKLLDNILPS